MMRWLLLAVILMCHSPLGWAMPSGGKPDIPIIYVMPTNVEKVSRKLPESVANLVRDTVIAELVHSGKWEHTGQLPTAPLRTPLRSPYLSLLPIQGGADYFAIPSLVNVSFSSDNGRCRVTIRVPVFTTVTGLLVNGAIATGYSQYSRAKGLSDEYLIVDALQDAARNAVHTINEYVLPEGIITENHDGEWILDNKRRIFHLGMSMVVIRNRRVVALMRVNRIESDSAYAVAYWSSPKPGDHAYAVFQLPGYAVSEGTGIRSSLLDGTDREWEVHWGAMPL